MITPETKMETAFLMLGIETKIEAVTQTKGLFFVSGREALLGISEGVGVA